MFSTKLLYSGLETSYSYRGNVSLSIFAGVFFCACILQTVIQFVTHCVCVCFMQEMAHAWEEYNRLERSVEQLRAALQAHMTHSTTTQVRPGTAAQRRLNFTPLDSLDTPTEYCSVVHSICGCVSMCYTARKIRDETWAVEDWGRDGRTECRQSQLQGHNRLCPEPRWVDLLQPACLADCWGQAWFLMFISPPRKKASAFCVGPSSAL